MSCISCTLVLRFVPVWVCFPHVNMRSPDWGTGRLGSRLSMETVRRPSVVGIVHDCGREPNTWVQWAAHHVQHLILTLTAHLLTYIPLITHSSLMTAFTSVPICKTQQIHIRNAAVSKADQLCLCLSSCQWDQGMKLKSFSLLHSALLRFTYFKANQESLKLKYAV